MIESAAGLAAGGAAAEAQRIAREAEERLAASRKRAAEAAEAAKEAERKAKEDIELVRKQSEKRSDKQKSHTKNFADFLSRKEDKLAKKRRDYDARREDAETEAMDAEEARGGAEGAAPMDAAPAPAQTDASDNRKGKPEFRRSTKGEIPAEDFTRASDTRWSEKLREKRNMSDGNRAKAAAKVAKKVLENSTSIRAPAEGEQERLLALRLRGRRRSRRCWRRCDEPRRGSGRREGGEGSLHVDRRYEYIRRAIASTPSSRYRRDATRGVARADTVQPQLWRK